MNLFVLKNVLINFIQIQIVVTFVIPVMKVVKHAKILMKIVVILVKMTCFLFLKNFCQIVRVKMKQKENV